MFPVISVIHRRPCDEKIEKPEEEPDKSQLGVGFEMIYSPTNKCCSAFTVDFKHGQFVMNTSLVVYFIRCPSHRIAVQVGFRICHYSLHTLEALLDLRKIVLPERY